MGDVITLRKETELKARADAVRRLLEDWAEWQKGYRARLGYSPKSAGLQSGYAPRTFDEMCDTADIQRNEIVDQCVDDLAPAQNAAIYHRYLASVFRMRDYEGSLLTAHETLERVFRSKGILW